MRQFHCRLALGPGGGTCTYLEMIDVDVEATFPAFGERVGEFRVGFA